MFYDTSMFRQKKCIFCILLFSVLLFSCGLKSKHDGDKQSEKILTADVLVILGEAFYEQDNILKYIIKMYTPQSVSDHIHILSYADMTAHSKQARTKVIKEYVDEHTTDYIISMGLPEGAGRWMLAVTEKYPDIISIALLPEEEVLPVQVSSAIVVQRADALDEESSDLSGRVDDNRILLLAGLLAAENCVQMPEKEPREQLNIGINTAYRAIFGNEISESKNTYTLLPYIDPDSNIPAYNHFILFEKHPMEEKSVEQEPS